MEYVGWASLGVTLGFVILSIFSLWANLRQVEELVKYHKHPENAPCDHDHDLCYQAKEYKSYVEWTDFNRELDRFKLQLELEKFKGKE